MITTYDDLRANREGEVDSLKRKSSIYSILRLIAAILSGFFFYKYYQSEQLVLLLSGAAATILFIVLVKRHQKSTLEKRLKDEEINILKDEVAHLEENSLPFENGEEYVDPTHPYTFDLDVFGDHSLFQYLNRTGTQMGSNKLASCLTSQTTNETIEENQLAVKELAKNTTWRVKLLALSRIEPDSKETLETLNRWLANTNKPIHKLITYASSITPFLITPLFITYFITNQLVFWNYGLLLFFINVGLLISQISKIKLELLPSLQIDKILKQYSLALEEIESASFKSEKLIKLQSDLKKSTIKSSTAINNLSKLFLRMDHVQNIFASPFLNGLFCYHIHQLNKLYKWRRTYGKEVDCWLNALGEMEALASLANFHQNHPTYAFPTLTQKQALSFEELGHPLISDTKRITNNVSFDKKRFIILTGSNMSGKSTFLRTLGVNMVLANAGAPVCASSATITSTQILASMRLSDSLSDSTSLFYAEIKRLKEIIEALKGKHGFVLLDEILRGTNSDDKRFGTIGMIKRMIELSAVGVVATHDLEVCKLTDESPEILSNQRFEVEIKNDELVFDYKLKEGICENKSASFLMKKMEII